MCFGEEILRGALLGLCPSQTPPRSSIPVRPYLVVAHPGGMKWNDDPTGAFGLHLAGIWPSMIALRCCSTRIQLSNTDRRLGTGHLTPERSDCARKACCQRKLQKVVTLMDTQRN